MFKLLYKKTQLIRKIDTSYEDVLDKISLTRFPTNNIEDFRFSGLNELVKKQPVVSTPMNLVEAKAMIKMMKRFHPIDNIVVILNGALNTDLSTMNCSPVTLENSASLKHLWSVVTTQGHSFTNLNSAFVDNSLSIIVEEKLKLNRLVLLFINGCEQENSSLMSGLFSTIMILGKDHVSLTVTEEVVALRGDAIQTNSVMACQLSNSAKIFHQYVQFEAPCKKATSFKTTIVEQESFSQYNQIEARLGNGQTRHDVFVNQLGPETITELKHFFVTRKSRSQALFSKIRLDYPKGEVKQLYKCISGGSQGIFDGNIKVNLLAKKSHAQQVSKILLLTPTTTVNIKPNLQIAADDVKCTHGCSAANIGDYEVFYLGSRGIDINKAKKVLTTSF